MTPDALIDLVAEALCTQWHNNPDAWHHSDGMHQRWRDMAHTAITTMKEHDA